MNRLFSEAVSKFIEIFVATDGVEWAQDERNLRIARGRAGGFHQRIRKVRGGRITLVRRRREHLADRDVQ